MRNAELRKMALSSKTRDKLKTVSTATIATALFKRGFRSQMIQNVQPLDPAKPTMVGEAFTLRYIPAREDLNPITVFQDRSHPQRKGVEDCPPGAVFVIDSRKDARAASAGSIVIPAHLADEIADEAVEMTAFEDFVTEKVHEGRSIMGLYPPTDEQTKKDFEVWRKAKRR